MNKMLLAFLLLIPFGSLSSMEKEAKSDQTCNFLNKSFKIVTANINLMPQGLNIATTGNPKKRAIQIVKSLLEQHPSCRK